MSAGVFAPGYLDKFGQFIMVRRRMSMVRFGINNDLTVTAD
jgi:hypothetical protein